MPRDATKPGTGPAAQRGRPSPFSCALAAALLTLLAGCNIPRDVAADLRTEVDELRLANDRLERENRALREDLAAAKERIAALEGLGGPERLEKLYRVKSIAIRRATYIPADDEEGPAVKVRLEPIDQHGNVLKAPGSATMRVFDLAAETDQLLAERRFTVDELAERFFGGFGVYHYTLACPLEDTPGAKELTVRVEFTAYLTGETFTDQATVAADPR